MNANPTTPAPIAPAKAESAEERLADLRRRRTEAADVLAETLLDLWLRERREAAAREPRAGGRSV